MNLGNLCPFFFRHYLIDQVPSYKRLVSWSVKQFVAFLVSLERLGGVFNSCRGVCGTSGVCIRGVSRYLLPRLGSVFKQFYPQSGTNIWDFLCVSWVGWGVGRSSRHFSALEFNLGPNLAASPQFFAFGFNLGLEYLGKVPGTRLLKTKAFQIIVSYWI